MIKLKDFIKKYIETIDETFSTGKSIDKKMTKSRSEVLGHKMIDEMPEPSFNIENPEERGDSEFPSGNLKEWTEKDEADGTIKRWSKPYGDKYTEYEKKKFGLKEVDEDVNTVNKKGKDGGDYRDYDAPENSDIEQPYRPKKELKKNESWGTGPKDRKSVTGYEDTVSGHFPSRITTPKHNKTKIKLKDLIKKHLTHIT